MKKVIMFTVCALAVLGCTKKNDNRSTVSNPFKSIKYWRPDTLTAGISHTPGIDTIFTFLSGDTSCILYNGQKLYVFYLSMPAGCNCTNANDSMQQFQGYVSPVAFDTSSAWTSAVITPYMYWSVSHNSWSEETQSLMLSQLYPHFDTSAFMAFYSHI